MTLIGVHNSDTPKLSTDVYPLTKAERMFKPGVLVPQNLIPAVTNTCMPLIADGQTVVWSFKPNPADVTNGAWQIYIEQLARYIRDNELSSHLIVCIWHEPEDDTWACYPNGTKKTTYFHTGHDFVNYFDTVHDWFKGVDPSIMTTHAALGYGYRPKLGGPHDKSAYVPDPSVWVTKADVNSIDIYSGRSFPITDTLAVSPAFKRWLASRPDGAQWGVSERGWPTDDLTGRVQAIADEFAWLKALPVAARPAFYIAWATEGTEKDPKLLLDPTAVQALNDGFALLAAPDVPTPVPDNPPVTGAMTCPLCHGGGTVPNGTYTITTNVMVQHAS